MRAARLTISLIFLGAMLASPSLASAAQSLAVTSPSGFPAGGDPTYTTNIGLASGAGTPSSLAIHLMPGVLASPAANPSCVTGTPQHTSACEIGTGTVTLVGLPSGAPVITAYLVPPPSPSDLVGIDLVSGGLLTIHAGAQLVQTADGNVQTILNANLSSLGGLASLITGMSLTVNGKLDGKPFNRMPTNCSPGHSTLTVAYGSKTQTTTASPDFKPTGCGALPYAPKFHATAHEDAHNSGATAVTKVSQAIGQAATSKMVLQLPSQTLNANLKSVDLLNTNKPVGSAVASTPLLPKPLRGKIFLVGSISSPLLKIEIPPPATLTLTGVVKLTKDRVTISHVPDVPLTGLTVSFPGAAESLLSGYCPLPTGPVTATFTSQSGKTVTDRQMLTLRGCSGHSG